MTQPGVTCRNCAAAIPPRVGMTVAEWWSRDYCYRPACARIGDRLDDIRFLQDVGESPERIAERVGISFDSLLRWLRRHGERDLAAQMVGSVAA